MIIRMYIRTYVRTSGEGGDAEEGPRNNHQSALLLLPYFRSLVQNASCTSREVINDANIKPGDWMREVRHCWKHRGNIGTLYETGPWQRDRSQERTDNAGGKGSIHGRRKKWWEKNNWDVVVQLRITERSLPFVSRCERGNYWEIFLLKC